MAELAGGRLGVDVGTVRVGVAYCGEDRVVALPWETFERRQPERVDLEALVRRICDSEIPVIYIGLPRTMRGEEGAAAQMSRQWAGELARALQEVKRDAQLRMVDERLSTARAHRQLYAAGLEGRKHRRVVDRVAAQEILEHALAFERAQGRLAGVVWENASSAIGTIENGLSR